MGPRGAPRGTDGIAVSLALPAVETTLASTLIHMCGARGTRLTRVRAINAIGITNGLIGVFGDIFKEASNNTFANNTEFQPILSRLTRIESILLGVDASNVEHMTEVVELAKEEAAHNGVSLADFKIEDLGQDFEGMEIREYSAEAVSKDNKITKVEERLEKVEMMLSLILARIPDEQGHQMM